MCVDNELVDICGIGFVCIGDLFCVEVDVLDGIIEVCVGVDLCIFLGNIGCVVGLMCCFLVDGGFIVCVLDDDDIEIFFGDECGVEGGLCENGLVCVGVEVFDIGLDICVDVVLCIFGEIGDCDLGSICVSGLDGDIGCVFDFNVGIVDNCGDGGFCDIGLVCVFVDIIDVGFEVCLLFVDCILGEIVDCGVGEICVGILGVVIGCVEDLGNGVV